MKFDENKEMGEMVNKRVGNRKGSSIMFGCALSIHLAFMLNGHGGKAASTGGHIRWLLIPTIKMDRNAKNKAPAFYGNGSQSIIILSPILITQILPSAPPPVFPGF
jgi:hypothetical protein